MGQFGAELAFRAIPTSRLAIMFLLAPVIRAMERMLHLSTKARTIADCISVLSLFILASMLKQGRLVNIRH